MLDEKNEFPEWLIITGKDPSLGRVQGTAPLDKLKYDEGIRGWRGASAYAEERLRGLKNSLNPQTGMSVLNPLHAVLDVDGDCLRVIGGSRRLAALEALTVKDKDGNPGIAPNSSVPVFIYRDTDRAKVLKLAALDNGFREDFGDIERLRVIESMEAAGIQVVEIAGLLKTSEDTVRRFLGIAKQPILRECLESEAVPYSKLAQLAKTISEDTKKTPWVVDTLTKWKNQAEKEMGVEEERLKKVGKPFPAAKRKLSAYLKPEVYRGWIDDLEAGRKPTNKLQKAKVQVEKDATHLRISGLTLVLAETTPDEIADAIANYEWAASRLKVALEAVKAGGIAAEKNFRETEQYQKRIAELLGKEYKPPVPPAVAPATEKEGDDVAEVEGDDQTEGLGDEETEANKECGEGGGCGHPRARPVTLGGIQ